MPPKSSGRTRHKPNTSPRSPPTALRGLFVCPTAGSTTMAQKMHVLHHTPSRDFSHEKTTDPDTPALRRSRRHARMGLPLTGRHAAAGQGVVWAETLGDLEACCRRKHIKATQYDHFAGIADREQRHDIARVFRAMAASERVQENSCAEAIVRLGGSYRPPARIGFRRGDGRQSRTEPQLRTPLAPRTARHGDRPCSPPGKPLCGPGADLGFGRRPAPRRDDGVVQKLARSGGPQRRLPGLPHLRQSLLFALPRLLLSLAARPTGGGSSAWSKPRRESRQPRDAAVYPAAARPAGLGAKA